MKSFFTFILGFGAGWAVRSISDSPQGVGVKLMEVALKAKERITHWAAIERERLEDMMAEAHTRSGQNESSKLSVVPKNERQRGTLES